MSLQGKNKKFYSYTNQKRVGSNFQYKDFEKTESYHTNFSNSNFSFVSFRSAKLKFCAFYNCIFDGTEFIETNLRGSKFNNSSFREIIFYSNVLEAVFTRH